jgi:hypothetical protein
MTAINSIPSHRPLSCAEDSSENSCKIERTEELDPPKLISPNQVSSSFQFLNAINAFCDLRESMMETATLRLEGVKETITENSNQVYEQLKNAAELAQNNDSWHLLKKVANSLTASFSAISGLTLLSQGSAFVGGALIASGTLSISNLVLSECKGWDWITTQLAGSCEQTKQKLNALLPTSVGVLAAGFGLVGSVYGITSGSLNFAEKISGIAQTSLSLFSGATNLGQGIAESKLTWTQAETLSSKESLHLKQDDYEQLADSSHLMLQEFNRTFRNAKKAIRSLTQTQFQLTR